MPSLRSLRPPLLLALGAFATLSLRPAAAGLPDRVGVELELGDAPGAPVVLPGDRVVAALIGSSSRVLAWRDTADLGTENTAISLDVGDPRVLAAGGTGTDPILLVGGDAVQVLRFDPSSIPASVTVDSSTYGLGASGSVSALLYSSELEVAYGLDTDAGRIHAIALGDETDELASFTPGFAPSGIALLDGKLLVVGAGDGAPAGAVVALGDDGAFGAATDLGLGDHLDGALLAVVSDGADSAWLAHRDGGDTLRLLALSSDGGPAGDDDDSAGDDDDSAAARGCTDLAADLGPFSLSTVTCDLASTADGFLYAEGEDLVSGTRGFVYVGGATSVQRVSVGSGAGATASLEPLSGVATGLGAASAGDGTLFATQAGTGLLAALVPGPWVEATDPAAAVLGSDSDTLDFEFTATGANDASCVWTLRLDGDIDRSGSLLAEHGGEAVSGEAVAVSVSGADLEAGSHRVFVFCTDGEGNVGRDSVTYYKGSLAAPDAVTALPGNEHVVVTWDGVDDSSVTEYRLYFDDWDFGATGTADGVNGDATQSSPLTTTLDDADSTDADDDDASRSFEVDVTSLANGTTWYFAVAAVDSDGTIGPRSTVVSATPGLTGGAAALAGDTYGCSCRAAPAPSGPSALLLLAGLAVASRRRTRHARNR